MPLNSKSLVRVSHFSTPEQLIFMALCRKSGTWASWRVPPPSPAAAKGLQGFKPTAKAPTSHWPTGLPNSRGLSCCFLLFKILLFKPLIYKIDHLEFYSKLYCFCLIYKWNLLHRSKVVIILICWNVRDSQHKWK